MALGCCLAIGACAPVSAPVRAGQPVPRDHPLAKIRPGMTFESVVDILGPPAFQEQHPTIYAFSPISFGPEVQWTEFVYARAGRVIFQGPSAWGTGARVVGVSYDPTESGDSGERD